MDVRTYGRLQSSDEMMADLVPIARYAIPFCLCATATTFLLSACAEVPDVPKSLYFERLIEVVTAGDYSRHELLEPISPPDEERVVGDLIADGFVPQDNSSSAKMFGYITCEDLVFARTDIQGETRKYGRSFIWGSLFITEFRVDVLRDADCSLVSVVDVKVQPGL